MLTSAQFQPSEKKARTMVEQRCHSVRVADGVSRTNYFLNTAVLLG